MKLISLIFKASLNRPVCQLVQRTASTVYRVPVGGVHASVMRAVLCDGVFFFLFLEFTVINCYHSVKTCCFQAAWDYTLSHTRKRHSKINCETGEEWYKNCSATQSYGSWLAKHTSKPRASFYFPVQRSSLGNLSVVHNFPFRVIERGWA